MNTDYTSTAARLYPGNRLLQRIRWGLISRFFVALVMGTDLPIVLGRIATG